MKEKVKRLQPKDDVTRELYLKSGNICAFPGCHNIMIDECGNFIGQICHIEAAEENGERFNLNMTNEDRRSFENLMLMCYEHHVVTNDTKNYTVDVLKKIKKDHEDKFSGIIQRIQNSLVDYGKVVTYKKSVTCKELSRVLNYQFSDDENIENSKILNELLDKLINLPVESRKLLSIMIDRSYYDKTQSTTVIPIHEVESAIAKDPSYMLKQIEILSRRNLISEHYLDDYKRPFVKILSHNETGWDYISDIQNFCKKKGIHLDTVIINIDFSIFD